MVPTTRQKAKSIGAKRYFTGLPCKHGHIAERYVHGSCAECMRIKCAERYDNNPEKWAAYSRDWKIQNPEQYKQRRRDYRMKITSRSKEMLGAAKWTAKKKGLSFDLDAQWILQKLQVGVCELTGLAFRFEPFDGGRQNPYTASLDRIVPKTGYVKSNVRVILWALNAAFNTYGEQVYTEIAKVYLTKRGTGLT